MDSLVTYEEVCKKVIGFLDTTSKFYKSFNTEE
jgi:hypothetical protein